MTTTQSRSPELEELIRDAFDFMARDIHVALPAQVESFDEKKQTVSVQPLIKRRDFLDTKKAKQVVRLPVINGVPVIFPRAGGYMLTMPIQKGDTVLLVFSHRSLEAWQKNGGEVDPGDTRHHQISDAVAIVGLHDDAHPIKDFKNDRLVLGKEGGPTVEVAEKEVNVKASGTGQKVNIEAGGDITINASGPGAKVDVKVGAGGQINLGGSSKQLAMMGDTAGPYPLVCKTLTVFGS